MVAKAKRIAHQRKESVSKMAEKYFDSLGRSSRDDKSKKDVPDWVSQLGIDPKKRRTGRKKSYDELRYEYLREKHLKD